MRSIARKWQCRQYDECLTRNKNSGKKTSGFCSKCRDYSPADSFDWFQGDDLQGYYNLFMAVFGTYPRI